jgi:hypothetical protein
MAIHNALQMGPKYLQNIRFQRFDRGVDIVRVEAQLVGRRDGHRTGSLTLVEMLIGCRD